MATVLATVPFDHCPSKPADTVLDATSTVVVIEDAVVQFMSRTGLTANDYAYNPDPEVERRLREELSTWNGVASASPLMVEKSLTVGIHVSTMFYSYRPIDVQVIVALYAFLIAMIDDFNTDLQALEEFSIRLCRGKEQLSPLLDCMAMILGRMPDYYLPYAAQSIAISTIQFINATAFDKRTEGMRLIPGTRAFADYKRDRSGVGEAFGFFAFDKASFPDLSTHVQVIPESIAFLSYVNDIFSLYKEELAGECNNYIHDRMETSQKSLEGVLAEIVDDSVASVERARQKLRGAKEREAYEQFMRGYIFFHFSTPRYKLKDLLGVRYL